MNLSLKEIEVMKELQREFPKQSSVKRLVEATNRDRSVIKNVLVGLKSLTFISVTDKNEVYLLRSGKEYLGLGSAPVKVSSEVATQSKPTSTLTLASSSPGKEIINKSTSIEMAFTELENKLNQKPLTIEELGLKLNVLKRLSVLLSPDIGEVLIDISSDLTRTNTPEEAA